MVRKETDAKAKRGRPAATPKEREDEMINLAMELAEQQLRDGTATPSVIVHYLKLGSTRGIIENEMLAKKSDLLRAQKEKLDSDKRMEDLYEQALTAMKVYGGQVEDVADEQPEDIFGDAPPEYIRR